MATKAEIKAAIQAQLTLNAGLTTHTQHEEFLHTETDSILENVYPTVVTEDQTTGVITTSNANMDYDVNIVKVGRQVTITGSFQCVSATTISSPTIFTINPSATEYAVDTTPIATIFTRVLVATGFSREVLSRDLLGVVMTDTADIFVSGSIAPGDAFLFEITYNTLN